MAERRDEINRVFEEWNNVYFSAAEKAAIGDGDVLAGVMAVYDALMDAGAGPQGMDESLRRFAVVAEREYPWLSDKARGKLLHAFVMNWK